jgi:hypothetical protein
LADKFVDRVPELKFSPAQLQDYFLLHKTYPHEAVEKVVARVEEGSKMSEESKQIEGHTKRPCGCPTPPHTAPCFIPRRPVGSQSLSPRIFILDESKVDAADRLTELLGGKTTFVLDIDGIKLTESAG